MSVFYKIIAWNVFKINFKYFSFGWQSNYYEHIILNQDEIIVLPKNNVANWQKIDNFY